jgi:GT2 family glycosyltransferase
VLHAPVNLGLAGGLHYARRHARGGYLAVVQDDVEVDDQWLGPLVEILDSDPTVGAVGSRIALVDGTPFADGMIVAQRARSRVVEPAERPDSWWAVDAFFSASCLVRADAWDSVGGANHRLFPNGHVDVDFGLRLAEAGWSVLVARDSLARHVRNASTTSSLRRYAWQRNRGMVARDHARMLADRPEHFVGAEEVAWLTHLSEVARQRRSSPPPKRTAAPAIPLPTLIRDARSDARRVRIGLTVFPLRLALYNVRSALVRSLRRAHDSRDFGAP